MSYKNPIKTDWMVEQMNHEPTRQYAEDIYKMVHDWLGWEDDTCKALEIGSAWGVSTLAILGVHPHIDLTSVDPDRTKAYSEVKANGLSDRWQGIETRSGEFWKNNDKTYDLIYIDGSHLFQDVYNDLFQAWEVLNKGGLLMVDDWTHKLNKDIDMDAKEPIFGVSYALCCFIGEKNIRNQKTTMQVWSTVKE